MGQLKKVVFLKIKKVIARQILDSRSNPTVEVDIYTSKGMSRAAVPSGASTGIHEAIELRDGGPRFLGKGVSKAVKNVNSIIAPKVKGKEVKKQELIDEIMIKLDKNKNKSRIGANAMLGVSLATARAAALESNKPLYAHISTLAKTKPSLPVPFCNVINGGKHAGNNLQIQEFMIAPVRAKTMSDAVRAVSETYNVLKDLLTRRFGKTAINVGDEGGFVPPMDKASQVLNMLVKAIDEAGYSNEMKIAIDAAASEFYNNKKYNTPRPLTGGQLTDYYLELIKTYPIISLEDPYDQDDFENFKELTKKVHIQIVGDDLTVTNVERIQKAVDDELCNALLLKVNQIGTLSESINSANLAVKNKWNVMVSHRSGETTDTFISDLAVGLGCGQLKCGAPCRGERVAKYNRLLRIEEEAGKKLKYAKMN